MSLPTICGPKCWIVCVLSRSDASHSLAHRAEPQLHLLPETQSPCQQLLYLM